MKKSIFVFLLLGLATLSFGQIKQEKTVKGTMEVVKQNEYSGYVMKLEKALEKRDLKYAKQILQQIEEESSKELSVNSRSKTTSKSVEKNDELKIINNAATYTLRVIQDNEDKEEGIPWKWLARVLRNLADLFDTFGECC